jgi:hypothetical protein
MLHTQVADFCFRMDSAYVGLFLALFIHQFIMFCNKIVAVVGFPHVGNFAG